MDRVVGRRYRLKSTESGLSILANGPGVTGVKPR